MKVFIVCGEGAPGNDRDLQAIEFWNYAVDLANWCVGGGFTPALYLPKRVSDRIRLGQPDRGQDEAIAVSAPISVAPIPIESVATLKSAVATARELKVLVVLAHGVAKQGGGGTVYLTPAGVDCKLESADVLAMQNTIYFGLHCHAGDFVATLNNTLAFHLTGADVGQNSDIKNFLSGANKETFLNVLNMLAYSETIDDVREKREPLEQAKQGMEQLAAATNRDSGKLAAAGVAGGVG